MTSFNTQWISRMFKNIRMKPNYLLTTINIISILANFQSKIRRINDKTALD